MQAIILAGGFGTRLKSLLGHELPKPMAPVAGKPFLSWLLEYMAGQGVHEAVLCVHHQARAIISYYGTQYAGIRLHYSREDAPLGTGGAIHKAMRMLNAKRPVLVLNGDSLVELNYRAMLAQHQHSGRTITLATSRVTDCSRYSRLTIENGMVTRYDLLGGTAPGDVSVGLYAVSPELFYGFELPQHFSFEQNFLQPFIEHIAPAAYRGVQYFIDIGVPKDYLRAQAEIPARMDVRAVA